MDRTAGVRRTTAIASVILGGGVAAAPAAAGDPVGDRAPAWDGAFDRSEGWIGADAAYSVALPDDRTLWLFGDTFVGRVADGARAPGAAFVHNTVAVHPTPSGGEPIDGASLRFHWTEADPDGAPQAWIAPDSAALGGAEAGEGWYWPGDGAVVAGPDDRRLVLFLHRMGRRPDGDAAFGFRSLGGTLALVDDPSRPVAEWRVRQLPLPHTVAAPEARARETPEVSWGAAVLPGGPPELPRLFVYGVRQPAGEPKELLVARAPAAHVERFGRWRFWSGDGWADRAEAARAVASGVVNELSVERREVGGRSRLVLVQSQPALGRDVRVRTAPRPEGPWSEPTTVFRVPEVEDDPSYFAYAAKGHAHLSAPGELLLTYVVNARDLAAVAENPSIYRPRFVRVPLGPLAPRSR